MKDEITHLLCRMNFHRWTEWETVKEVPLIPLGDHEAIHDIDDVSVELLQRKCRHCSTERVRKVFRW